MRSTQSLQSILPFVLIITINRFDEEHLVTRGVLDNIYVGNNHVIGAMGTYFHHQI